MLHHSSWSYEFREGAVRSHTHYTFDIVYYENKMPVSTWIICSLPFLFWITAGLLILKLRGNECNDGTRTIAELDTEAFLAETIGDGTTAKFMVVG
jgi:hypothetical protein